MESLHNYLTAQIDRCQTHCAKLRSDNRADEAVFEKIRGNVFDIFRSVLTAAEKQSEPESFFRERLEQIPAQWEHALTLAKEHGDDEKAHIESIKLSAVREIRAFLSLEVKP